MLIRISLILAIIASLAVAGLSFVMVKERIETTMKQRDEERTAKETAQNELAKTKKTLSATQTELTTTSNALASTKSELETMTAKASSEEKRANDLSANLGKMTGERNAAQQELQAWKGTGLTPDQIKTLVKDLKTTVDQRDHYIAENKVLLNKYTRLDAKYKALLGDEPKVELPAGLKGKVIAVDPKFDFVVLDIGGNQGVLERGEMLVNRRGAMIARIRITTVEPNRSVANVIPGWGKSENVKEGDQVLY